MTSLLANSGLVVTLLVAIGFLLCWHMLRQARKTLADEIRRAADDPRTNLIALDAAIARTTRASGVYTPIRLRYADRAPAPAPGSYRDDTGKSEAAA